MSLLDWGAKEISVSAFPKPSPLFPFFCLMVTVALELKLFQKKKWHENHCIAISRTVEHWSHKEGNFATSISHSDIIWITGIGRTTSSGTAAGSSAWDYRKERAGAYNSHNLQGDNEANIFATVLGLTGMEFTFFIAAHMVLCSRFVIKTNLITQPYFGNCWTVLAYPQGFLLFSLASPTLPQIVHR